MNRKYTLAVRVFIISLLVFTMIFGAAGLAEGQDAGGLFTLYFEGQVLIEDAGGEVRFAETGTAFGSGEAVTTSPATRAEIQLDASKILTLDAGTRVEFEKDGEHLKLNLTAGTLLLYVKEKLNENETLDVSTSQMSAAIRGTILYITTLDRVPERLSDLFAPSDVPALDEGAPAPSDLREILSSGAEGQGGHVSQLGVLQGAVQLSFADEQGQEHSLIIESGQKATLIDRNENDLVDMAPDVTDITPVDLEGFLEDTINKDPELSREITDNLEEMLPPIAFFTDSAEKEYDGTPLTCYQIKVIGLPEGYTYTCVFRSSQTDVGKCDNELLSYKIYNPRGRDVTSAFTEIEIYPGTLKVFPAPIIITTESATKPYDGTPLTNAGATAIGLALDETIDVITDGTVTYVGTEKNTYTIDWGETNPANYSITEYLGTLEVTPNDTPIRFTAGSGKKVYDGSALTNGRVTITGLPDTFRYRAVTTGSQVNAGSSKNQISYYKIFDGEDVNVTACFSNVTVYNGTLTVEPLELAFDLSGAEVDAYGNLSIPNPSVTYLNGPHEGETVYGMRTRSLTAGYNFVIFTGDTVGVTVTAEETEKGTYRLSCEATVPGSEYGNIVLSYSGDTEIPKPSVPQTELLIRTSSASKLYDGTELTSTDVTVEGLEDGDSITVTATGTITDVGTAVNTYSIEWGDTDPEKYIVTEDLGTLEITGDDTAITITAGSAEKVYDGTELTDGSFTVSGLPAEFTCEATVTGSQKDAGDGDNVIASYTITNADGKDLTGRFTNVTTANGTLKVTPLGLAATVSSYGSTYDGGPNAPEEIKLAYSGGSTIDCENSELIEDASGRAAGIACTFKLLDGGTLKITCMGESDAGDHTYKPALAYTGTAGGNYEVSFTGLSYHIDPLDVELVLNGCADSIAYDGAFHGGNLMVLDNAGYFTCLSEGNSNWKATGIKGEVITVHIDGGGTDVGPYTLSCSYELTSGNSGNFNIYDAGKNFEIVKNDSPVTLTADSASKPYDGTALTASGFTVSGLPGTLTVNATVTGSQINVGTGTSSISTYAIMNGGTNVTGNFTEIITVNGTLTVTENGTSITLTPKSCSKVYDGTPLNGSEVIAEGLPGGFSVSATFDGSQTVYGSSNVTIASYAILNASSEDVTGYFTGVTTAFGTLSVDKLQIELELGGTTRQYNGSYGDGLTPKLKYLNGDYTNTVISPSSLNQYPGGCNASFSLYTGDTATLTVSGYTSYDADTYTLSGSCNLSSNPSYSVSTTNNKVVITPAPITVSSVSISETKTYDGIPLPENTNQPDIIGTVYDQIEVYKLSDQITDVGEKTLKFTIEWPDDKTSGNYTVTEEYGTLEITKASLKITSHSGSKPYDGEPLTVHECDKEGLAYGEDVTINYTGTRTEQGEAPNSFTVTWDNAKEDNYVLTTVFGTLTITQPEIVGPSEDGGS